MEKLAEATVFQDSTWRVGFVVEPVVEEERISIAWSVTNLVSGGAGELQEEFLQETVVPALDRFVHAALTRETLREIEHELALLIVGHESHGTLHEICFEPEAN